MIEIVGVPCAGCSDVGEMDAVVTANGHTESLRVITYRTTYGEIVDLA